MNNNTESEQIENNPTTNKQEPNPAQEETEGTQVENPNPQTTNEPEPNPNGTGFSDQDKNKDTTQENGNDEEKKKDDKEYELPCDLYLKLFGGILGMLYGKDEPAKDEDVKNMTREELKGLTDDAVTNGKITPEEAHNINDTFNDPEKRKNMTQEQYDDFAKNNPSVNIGEAEQAEIPIEISNPPNNNMNATQISGGEAEQVER